MNKYVCFLIIILLNGCLGKTPTEIPNNITNITAKLSNTKYDALKNSISVDFVLKNQTKYPIRLFERQNMWGANQWWFIIFDGENRFFTYVNPQRIWTGNTPSTFELEASCQFVLHCKLLLKDYKNHLGGSKGAIFSQVPYKGKPTGQITLCGLFRIGREGFEFVPKNYLLPNWFGEIITNRVKVNLSVQK